MEMGAFYQLPLVKCACFDVCLVVCALDLYTWALNLLNLSHKIMCPRWTRKGGMGEEVFDFVGLAYQGKDIVCRFIIEYYSSLRDFGPLLINRPIFI